MRKAMLIASVDDNPAIYQCIPIEVVDTVDVYNCPQGIYYEDLLDAMVEACEYMQGCDNILVV